MLSLFFRKKIKRVKSKIPLWNYNSITTIHHQLHTHTLEEFKLELSKYLQTFLHRLGLLIKWGCHFLICFDDSPHQKVLKGSSLYLSFYPQVRSYLIKRVLIVSSCEEFINVLCPNWWANLLDLTSSHGVSAVRDLYWFSRLPRPNCSALAVLWSTGLLKHCNLNSARAVSAQAVPHCLSTALTLSFGVGWTVHNLGSETVYTAGLLWSKECSCSIYCTCSIPYTAYILQCNCSVLVVYTAESVRCASSVYCIYTALPSGLWQEVRAVGFRKACSNSANWLWIRRNCLIHRVGYPTTNAFCMGDLLHNL